jgi:hypothetical protein
VRRLFSVAAIVAALVCVEPALGDTPASVYTDFAEDGILSCGHSRAALNGVLTDASLYQYGDPLTFLQLKLAIRRQLARGCRRQLGAADSGNSASSGTGESGGTQAEQAAANRDAGQNPQAPGETRREAQRGSGTAQSQEVKEEGAMVLLGAGLLLLALGSGGWAAKRAFTS